MADRAGYMSNYFRWFGSPEDPFGWYYNVLALMTHVSDASIWIRLPDLACALICWLLLSRGAAPARSGGGGQQARAVGGGPRPARSVDAVQQRSAAGRADRYGCAHHLRADRAGHHFPGGWPAALAILSAAFTSESSRPASSPSQRFIAGGRPLLEFW